MTGALLILGLILAAAAGQLVLVWRRLAWLRRNTPAPDLSLIRKEDQ